MGAVDDVAPGGPPGRHLRRSVASHVLRIVASVFAQRAFVAHGWSEYVPMLPNGGLVQRNGKSWPASGHSSANSGRGKNFFGRHFKDAGNQWTLELCQRDSDGDGQTNGEELGDPDCIWKPGDTPLRTTDISHPGYDDSTTSFGENDLAESGDLGAAAAGCEASGLTVGDVAYSCKMDVDGGVVLHWKVLDDAGTDAASGRRLPAAEAKVDFALEKTGANGWVSLGFPSTPGMMSGAHAVVGGSASDVTYYDMKDLSVPTIQLTADTMMVPLKGAASVAQNGKLVLTLSEVQVADTSSFNVIWGVVDQSWPALHTGRGGATLNLLSGGSSAGIAQLMTDADKLVMASVWVLGCTFVAGAAMMYCVSESVPSLFNTPAAFGLSFPAMFAYAMVFLAFGLAGLAPKVGGAHGATAVALGLGLAAALAGAATMWLAWMKAGLHNFLYIPREVAWPIHAFFGKVFLLFGTMHGMALVYKRGLPAILEQPGSAIGIPGVALMWVAVLPALLLEVLPKALRYDTVKLVHLLAPVGYLLTLVHIAAQLSLQVKLRVLVLVVLTAMGLLGWLATRWLVVRGTKTVKVVSAKVISDASGQHVALEMLAPWMSLVAGQWVRLHVPSAGMVGHPFTAFAGREKGVVCVCIKAQGKFTRKLLDADLQDATVRLEGPYGASPVLPALRWSQAILFVAGGVGVTPALSLLPLASVSGHKCYLYWSVRSQKLFEYAKPWFEGRITRDQCHIQLTGPAADLEANDQEHRKPHGLSPARERLDLSLWLSATCKQLTAKYAGGCSVLIFVCGPPGMVKSTQNAAGAAATEHPGLRLHVRSEHFNFIPPLFQRGSKDGPREQPKPGVATE